VALTLALAGDTMLGRRVAERLAEDPCAPLLDPKLVETARSADLFLLNLECCISAGGAPIDEPGKPFFFRAPPLAAERLAEIGVRCVTPANNHVLDFGADALADALAHLAAVGIATVGAGRDLDQARAATILSAAGQRLRVIAVTDHPASYAAGRRRPGTAFADLAGGSVPDWLRDAANPRCGEYALVTAHMFEPQSARRGARDLAKSGARRRRTIAQTIAQSQRSSRVSGAQALTASCERGSATPTGTWRGGALGVEPGDHGGRGGMSRSRLIRRPGRASAVIAFGEMAQAGRARGGIMVRVVRAAA
jgi:Bacterial capsule synthesis protein PGA_cap